MSLEPRAVSVASVVLVSEAYVAAGWVKLKVSAIILARAAPLLAATSANCGLMLSRTSQSVEPSLPYAHVTDSSARESVSLSIGRGIGQRSVVFSFSFSKRNAPESAIVLTVWTGGSCCFHAQFLTDLLSIYLSRIVVAK